MSADHAAAGPASERPGAITTVHRYDLSLPREEVWRLISDVSHYRDWWPWLRVFDGAALAKGEEWRCEVQPPVPYPVRFRVVIEHIEAPGLVCASVSGDVVGVATLTLDEARRCRVHGHAAELARPGEHGPAAGLPIRRPPRPFRARLGPRFGGPPVHRPRHRTTRGRLDSLGVKFSIRQILASAAGAVIAAVIASTFGVKGTIVGVAIGSAAATMATALVAQSIERGHEAVKQVVVRAPEASTLLRKLGGTGASGGTAASAEAAPTQVVGRSAPEDGGSAETVQMESVAAPVGETERLEISATADAPATERLRATTAPMRPAGTRPGVRRFSWRTIAATVAIVFVLALVFITAIELISGKPLSAIFGGSDTGTTLSNLGGTPAAPTTTPTSTPRDDVDHLDLVHDHDDVRHEHDDHHRADRRIVDDDFFHAGRRRPLRAWVRHRHRRRRRRRRECPGYQPLNSAGRRSTKLAMPSVESSVLVSSSCPRASS